MQLQFPALGISCFLRMSHSFYNHNAPTTPQSQFAKLMRTFVHTTFPFRVQPQFGRATGMAMAISGSRESPRARCLTLAIAPTVLGRAAFMDSRRPISGCPLATRARDFTRHHARMTSCQSTLQVVPCLRAGQASRTTRMRFAMQCWLSAIVSHRRALRSHAGRQPRASLPNSAGTWSAFLPPRCHYAGDFQVCESNLAGWRS